MKIVKGGGYGNNYPLISVVIPTFNRKNFITKAIESIINQSVKNIEIIVVDNGSTDGTDKVLEQLIKKYSSLRFYVQPKNMGAQTARNKGIQESKGDWIAFLDSDDEYLPQKLEWQLKELEKVNFDPFTVIHGNCIVIDEKKAQPYIWNLPEIFGKDVYRQVLTQSGPMFQAMLTSKEALKKIGFLDTKVHAYQEWDTSISLAKYCQFIFLKQPLFVYNIHGGETISKDNEKAILGYEYIIQKNKADIIKFCGIDVWKKHLFNLYNFCLKANFTTKAEEIKKTLKNIE